MEEKLDYLVCEAASSVEPSEEEGPHYVMKPWLLRTTPFDGQTFDGITYETTPSGYIYDEDDQNIRLATEDDEEEWQAITPAYIVGELIYAHAISAVGLTIDGNPVDVTLADANTAGRCWALTDTPEES